MGDLVEGDDGLPAEIVGVWAKEKHDCLCRYVDISRKTRTKYLGFGKAGATYIDLFCGPGRCRVRNTDEWIDGGVVAAWKKSQEGGAPFSQVFIADIDAQRRQAAAIRLRNLGAPVVEVDGAAVGAAKAVTAQINAYGLHFAFLDPFDLRTLDFNIIVTLSALRRIDMLVHVSLMDLQRNTKIYATKSNSPFDTFAPGWRDKVSIAQSQQELRKQIFYFWRNKVASLGVWPSIHTRLISGGHNQPLYWLLMAAKHPLPHKFWSTASNIEGQGEFDF